MNLLPPRYLGDAVYIQPWLDGYGLVLTTDTHKVDQAPNSIFLEPEVVAALLSYLTEATTPTKS